MLSEEHKQKISEALKNRKLSEEHKKNIGRYQVGRKHKPETIEKIKKARANQIFTEETRIKMSKNRKGKPKSEEFRKHLSLIQKGNKSRFWKGGITEVNSNIRGSVEMKLWREAIFKRDNWACILCRARSRKGKTVILNADHIKPFAYYPKLRFEINNGRTLCVECHRKTDSFGEKAKKYSDLPRQDVAEWPYPIKYNLTTTGQLSNLE